MFVKCNLAVYGLQATLYNYIQIITSIGIKRVYTRSHHGRTAGGGGESYLNMDTVMHGDIIIHNYFMYNFLRLNVKF